MKSLIIIGIVFLIFGLVLASPTVLAHIGKFSLTSGTPGLVNTISANCISGCAAMSSSTFSATSGNIIAVGVDFNDWVSSTGLNPSVTDSLGNSWTLIDSNTLNGNPNTCGNYCTVDVFAATVATTGTDSITINAGLTTGSILIGFFLAQLSGYTTTGATFANGQGVLGTSSTLQTSAFTPLANSFILAVAGINLSFGTCSAASGYSTFSSFPGSGMCAQYELASPGTSTTSPISTTSSSTSGYYWGMVAVAFKQLAPVTTMTTTSTSVITTTSTIPTTITSTATSTNSAGATVQYIATVTTYSTTVITSTASTSVTSTQTNTQTLGATFYIDGTQVISGNAYTTNNATLQISAVPFTGTSVSSFSVVITPPSGSATTLTFAPGSYTTYTLTSNGNYAIKGYMTLTSGVQVQELSFIGNLNTAQQALISVHVPSILTKPNIELAIISELTGGILVGFGVVVRGGTKRS